MGFGRIVAVGAMALGVTLGVAVPASAAPGPMGPGSAAQCKAAGGQVVEGKKIDRFQEQYGIDDSIDVGECVGGAYDGTPIVDPTAGPLPHG